MFPLCQFWSPQFLWVIFNILAVYPQCKPYDIPLQHMYNYIFTDKNKDSLHEHNRDQLLLSWHTDDTCTMYKPSFKLRTAGHFFVHYYLLGRDTAVKLVPAVCNATPCIWSSTCTPLGMILHRKYFQIGACIHGL